MNPKERVLVTGATGFLGRRTAEMLIKQGFSVRALVRTPSKAGNLARLGAEIAQGDVTDPDSLKPAFEDIDYVIHAAADTSGTEQGARQVTINGTRNILDLCASRPVKKLIYISSCSVYGSADYKDGQVVDENSPLEGFPERRGIYSWAKLEAEKIVMDYMNQDKVRAVCLRPGTIFGHGGENFSPMMGFTWKNKVFIVINMEGFTLPLVYIDNLIQAIIAAMVQDKSTGHVYNVVDSQQIGKKEYMDKFIRKLFSGAWCFYVPYSLLSSAVSLQETLFSLLNRKPLLTKYRLISSQKLVIFDASKIINHLGWNPSFSYEQAVEEIVAQDKGYSKTEDQLSHFII
jgi:2-alkyl-3-oxoalkanoate reductase